MTLAYKSFWTMSSQIKIRSNRGRGNGKLNKRGLHSPVPNARSTRSSALTSLSPAHVSKLPVKGINITERVKNAATKSHLNGTSNDSSGSVSNAEDRNSSSPLLRPRGGALEVQPVVEPRQGTGDISGDTSGSVRDDGTSVKEPGRDLLNRGAPINTPVRLAEDPDQAKNILLVLNEIRDIKKQIVKLDTIEATTATLSEQLGGAIKRTAELESEVSNQATKIRKLDDGLTDLNNKIGKQEKILVGVKNMKVEIAKASAETVAQMNELIDVQKQQVDSFNAGSEQLKNDILAEMNKKLEKRDNDRHCDSLKQQAFKCRHNLIIIGMSEDPNKSTPSLVKDFFTKVLNLRNMEMNTAFRLGSQPGEDSDYNRPIVVKFNYLTHRNAVWRKRNAVPKEDNGNQIRIQADLPKALREGVQKLYKITRAAANIKGFESARVYDYQLEVNGDIYQITDLEELPTQLRPSTIASPKSDTHMVFFSSDAKLSNHHPSKFIINGQSFNSMEHFLAVRRAELSGDRNMIRKAKNVQDPIQAKHILNALKNDHQQEWNHGLEELALEGLRAKFGQNQHLNDYLYSTKHLILGEASTNARWGIGMELTHPEVLDHTKWLQSGNLLGRSLMTIRAEIIHRRRHFPK